MTDIADKVKEQRRLDARRKANPCLHCQQPKPEGTGTRYCSPECREAARLARKRATKRSKAPCLHCGKPRPPEADGRVKFCSTKCQDDYAYVSASGSQTARAAAMRKWRQRNQHSQHGYYLKRTYGITPDQYDALLDAQNGVCFICHKYPGKKRLAVDHDHKTGFIRGLLHVAPCNRMLGDVRDLPDVLRRAADYLDNPPAFAVIGKVVVPS